MNFSNNTTKPTCEQHSCLFIPNFNQLQQDKLTNSTLLPSSPHLSDLPTNALCEGVDNLCSSTMVSAIFTDCSLIVRKFAGISYPALELGQCCVGQHLRSIMQHFSAFNGLEAAATVLRTQNSMQCELRGDNGKYYGLRMVPYKSIKGRVAGLACTLVEIKHFSTVSSEEIRLQAQAAIKAKSVFLATMNHELRTPINAIMGFTHLLDGKGLDAEQKTYLKKIQQGTDRLLSVVSDVLDYSDIELGKVAIINRPFPLRGCMKAVVQNVSHMAREKGLELSLVFDPTIPASLEGDPRRLSQTFLYLLENALKFTAQGSIHLRATLMPQPKGKNRAIVRFEVIDTGIGIAPEQQGRIFSSFTQADDGMCREFSGVGLGLAIANKLVQLMGGEIKLKSTLGHGSCFSFDLGLGLSSICLPCETSDKTAFSVADITKALAGKPVLVVEDDPLNVEIMCALLQAYRLKIHVARNGLEALEAAKKQQYECIFMDLQMPIMDGLEATAHLRNMGNLPHTQWLAQVPIVAISANCLPSDKSRSHNAGLSEHLGKPINPDLLRESLPRWFGLETTTQNQAYSY